QIDRSADTVSLYEFGNLSTGDFSLNLTTYHQGLLTEQGAEVGGDATDVQTVHDHLSNLYAGQTVVGVSGNQNGGTYLLNEGGWSSQTVAHGDSISDEGIVDTQSNYVTFGGSGALDMTGGAYTVGAWDADTTYLAASDDIVGEEMDTQQNAVTITENITR